MVIEAGSWAMAYSHGGFVCAEFHLIQDEKQLDPVFEKVRKLSFN